MSGTVSGAANETRTPAMPEPILDERECAELDALTQRYERLASPGPIGRAVKKVATVVPTGVKDAVTTVKSDITEREIYEQALKLVGSGFKVLEEQAARVTVSEASIIRNVNAVSRDADIESIAEICRLRSYDVSTAVNKKTSQHILAAAAEGGGTGVAGFAGIPFNIVLSTLFYYRAVQSVALSYGYDVKNDPAELVMASEVCASALSPKSGGEAGVPDNVAKFMAISVVEGVGQTAKKTWAAMIERGGPALLLAQMRALANASARKALQGAGKRGLENSAFREIFEQIGRRLTLKAIQRAVPVVSAGIGALVDAAQMRTVLQYADIFYHKRFLIEKQDRVRLLFGVMPEPDTTVADEPNAESDGPVTESDDLVTGSDEPMEVEVVEERGVSRYE